MSCRCSCVDSYLFQIKLFCRLLCGRNLKRWKRFNCKSAIINNKHNSNFEMIMLVLCYIIRFLHRQGCRSIKIYVGKIIFNNPPTHLTYRHLFKLLFLNCILGGSKNYKKIQKIYIIYLYFCYTHSPTHFNM